MITWGVSAGAHNAALSVFEDDSIVFASSSERFSGIKNDPDLCRELIDHVTDQFGQPDLVCWYEQPWKKAFRKLTANKSWELENPKLYMSRFGVVAPIKTCDHHFSHAAAGYYTSPFDEATVIVLDAIGEFTTYSLWSAEGEKIHFINDLAYPHSAGLFYSAMTQRVGLKPIEEEYILMGMAAYGDANRFSKDLLEEFVEFPNDDYQNPFRLRQNLHRGCNWWRPELNTQQDLYDIAAATQSVYEMMFERVLQSAKHKTGSRNLVLMGGCALNCAANPLAYKYFDNVWIMPAPGDDGSAIGAVLAQKKKHVVWPGPYLGFDMGYHSSNEEIVAHLLEHKVCGVARGPAEFGPRALGNRSLLGDPRDPKIRVLINNIKQREQYRPFAPMVLEEFAKTHFKMPAKTALYMQYAVVCLTPKLYPAIIHHDQTSRVQTVPNDGSPTRKLLELWYEASGCPILLNTSLNIKGKPMVNNITDSMTFESLYGVKVFN
jgi:carbamoyltransferase